MLMRTSKNALTGTLLLVLLAAPLGAQERTVLSKEVAVGRAEASLGLEFQDEQFDNEPLNNPFFFNNYEPCRTCRGDVLTTLPS